MKIKNLLTTILIVTFVLAFSTTAVAQQVSGAAYTTNINCATVDQNLYDAKTDVYINGGPSKDQNDNLNSGSYWVKVTEPEGKLLGKSAAPVAIASDGLLPCYELWNLVFKASDATQQGYDTTSNEGGEYKVWISLSELDADGSFPNSATKTDNFKVKKEATPPPCDPQTNTTCTCDSSGDCCDSSVDPSCQTTQPPPPATVSVCKYNDWNRNGVHNGDEPLLEGWQITATGVDGDSGSGVTQATLADGCTTFTYTFDVGETSRLVTLKEVQQTGWVQSAPLDADGNVVVTQSLTLNPGDNAIAYDFGNYLPASDPTGSKTAAGTFDQPYSWGITKAVDKTLVEQGGGSATFNYTVNVTRTTGTINGIAVSGVISVFNQNFTLDADNNPVYLPVTIDSISDVLSDTAGDCSVTGTFPATLTVAQTDFPYSCSISGSSVPTGEKNNATISWSTQVLSNGASLLEGSATPSADVSYTQNSIDNCVKVTDPLDPNSGHNTCASATYNYSKTVSAPAGGQCTTVNNTATFTTNTNGTQDSASKTVNLCNTKTGALTMGFWQGTQGQKVINGDCLGARNALKYYAPGPFTDLAATAVCKDVLSYINNLTNAANSSGTGVLMLKGQMMATILTSYFSAKTPNPLSGQGTVNNLGNVYIQLNKIRGTEDDSPAFIQYTGTNAKEQIWKMIADANTNWSLGLCSTAKGSCTGTGPYINKSVLVLGSNAFAYINQAQANIAP